MQTSRRNFLKKTALAVAGTSILSNELFASRWSKSPQLLGVQLYSIRKEMEADPSGSLKQVAAMGYKYVEHASYGNRKFYGYEAKEFKKVLDDLGLKMPSGHTVMGKAAWDESTKDFTDAWKFTVEDAAVLGQQYVISPWMDVNLRKDYDGVKRLMEVFNKSGELCKKSGMKFGYHNHDFEFKEKLNDMTIYDIVLQNTDPSLVIQQLDIGNMYGGGGRAMDILNKYPGRIQSMHVKDEIKTEGKEGYESAVLGTGIIGVKDIIDAGKKSGGTTHFIIEQESYQGKSPMDSIKEDYAIMKKWGY